MNQKELNEIRRRFRLDKNNFSHIFGCYVNSNREVISWIDASLGLMRQEEQEMYLGLLKKTLSGTLGRNLIDIEFSTAQVADSDEHRLLQTLRQTECKDANARETLCRKIIESLSMGETNYLILLAADAYDVPYRGKDDELQADASGDVYKYFVCAICPVKAPTLELRYDSRAARHPRGAERRWASTHFPHGVRQPPRLHAEISPDRWRPTGRAHRLAARRDGLQHSRCSFHACPSAQRTAHTPAR